MNDSNDRYSTREQCPLNLIHAMRVIQAEL